MDDYEQVEEVRMSRTVRGRERLPDFPCGCHSPGTQGAKIMILASGVRVCQEHGKKWHLSWEEVA